MTNTERSRAFNDSTGALSWGRRSANEHPHRCVCQAREMGRYAGTPHKHYAEAPHMCARCECRAYEPAFPDLGALAGINVFGACA